MIINILKMSVVLGCWALAVWKLVALLRDRSNRPLRALTLALVSITSSLTVHGMMSQIDQFVGRVDTGRVLSNLFTISCVAGAQLMLLHVSTVGEPARVAARSIARLASFAIVSMIVLYLAVPPAFSLSDPYVASGAFYTDREHTPIPSYVYLVYVPFAVWTIVRLSVRYSRQADAVEARIGFRTCAIGATFGLGYCVVKLVYIFKEVWGLPIPGSPALATPFYSICIVVVLIGCTIKSWGPKLGLSRLTDWWSSARAYRRLGPLWRTVTNAVPHVILLARPTSFSGRIQLIRKIDIWALRRGLEIDGARDALAPFMTSRVAEQARASVAATGAEGMHAAALVEAIRITAAMRLYTQQFGEPEEPVDARPTLLPDAGQENVWREAVSQAFSRANTLLQDQAEPGRPLTAVGR